LKKIDLISKAGNDNFQSKNFWGKEKNLINSFQNNQTFEKSLVFV
jgi:hypothetical protein